MKQKLPTSEAQKKSNAKWRTENKEAALRSARISMHKRHMRELGITPQEYADRLQKSISNLVDAREYFLSVQNADC